MFITTKMIGFITGEIYEQWFAWYEGPVDLACSGGDDTAKQSEQVSLDNQKQQMAFQQQLMTLFQQQYANQQALMNFAKPFLENMVTNPTGYSKADLTAMRSGASDTVATATQNARAAAQASQAAHGTGLPSGVSDQIDSSIASAGSQQLAGEQQQITESDDQLKLSNYWKAIGALSGQAELEAPQSYAGAATNAGNAASTAGNSVANLSSAVLNSQQAGWQDLGGIISGIGGLATGAGAIGSSFFPTTPCHVAAALYGGWFDHRTIAIRRYLQNDFGRRWYGDPLVWLYAKTGKRLSRNRIVVSMLRPLFDLVLQKAMA